MPFHLKYIPKKNYVIYFQPFNDTYLPLVGPQIILSQKLSIQNNNHTQQHKYLRGNPFFFEGKNHGTNFESIHYLSNQLQ